MQCSNEPGSRCEKAHSRGRRHTGSQKVPRLISPLCSHDHLGFVSSSVGFTPSKMMTRAKKKLWASFAGFQIRTKVVPVSKWHLFFGACFLRKSPLPGLLYLVTPACICCLVWKNHAMFCSIKVCCVFRVELTTLETLAWLNLSFHLMSSKEKSVDFLPSTCFV